MAFLARSAWYLGATMIVEVHSLVCGYAGQDILREVSFSLARGEFAALAGPNGAGKSTLLRCLAGLVLPRHGSVTIDGRPLNSYSRRQLAQTVAVVFQQIDCRYEYTVEDLVQLGRTPHEPAFALVARKADAVVERALAWTETTHLRQRLFRTLSGGEQQRVMLAMALAQEPRLLLLDEPSSHLDLSHQLGLYERLSWLRQQQGLSILLITHDLSLCAQYVDRLLLLRKGNLVYDGPVTSALSPDRLRQVFDLDVIVQPHPQTGKPVLFPAFNKA